MIRIMNRIINVKLMNNLNKIMNDLRVILFSKEDEDTSKSLETWTITPGK